MKHHVSLTVIKVYQTDYDNILTKTECFKKKFKLFFKNKKTASEEAVLLIYDYLRYVPFVPIFPLMPVKPDAQQT